jgi:hypothetical protein
VAGLLYFVVGERPHGPFSFTWRIWAQRTSFYVKPRTHFPSDMKISLHGPDERDDIGPPGYKIEVLGGGDAAVMTRRSPQWPDKGWFPGKPVADDIDLVLRFRFPWTMFSTQLPGGPFPGEVKPSAYAARLPPPASLRATDVDVFISHHGRPYWPREQQARRDNACIGPLENKAGQVLTGVVVHRSPYTVPLPSDLTQPRPSPADAVRAVGLAPDPTGFVWLSEMWLSRAYLQS